MKVFIQIPCLDEEKTLPLVFKTMPKELPGVTTVEWLIIDDGSTDRTVEVAKELGVKHIISHKRNMGLARSFRDGIDYALKNEANIVVNTDGDNQYPQERIVDLIQPILKGKADIVIGDRQTSKIAHFSGFKKLMQRFGSSVVNLAAGTSLPDAASGFRAYSRDSLIELNIVTPFSYCMETIIQAGNKRLRIESIPVETNEKTRESRLFKNIWQHMFKSAQAILRSYIMFKPHIVFVSLGLLLLILGLIPFIRYVVLLLAGEGGGHLQSLILGSALIIGSLLCFVLLVIADLQKTNRILLEDQLERIKEMQYKK